MPLPNAERACETPPRITLIPGQSRIPARAPDSGPASSDCANLGRVPLARPAT